MSDSLHHDRIEIRQAIDLPDSPYPGLRSFRLDEWPIFFGRERMVDDVIDRIGASQFVMVHGASGSGKSSLVRAGVIAQLQREHANRKLDWRPATMMPGSSPMWHFAAALVSALTGQDIPDHSETSKTRLRLNRGADGVAEVLHQLGFGKEQRLFILVDQFEEIFRFADEGGMREAADFIRLLVDLHNQCLDNVYVALTMRSDHLGDCSRFAGLAETVNATQYLVPPMDEVELEDAICRPARIYNGSVDKALALQLIRDTRHSSDQLPLVQHALAYMWRLEQSPDSNEAPNLNCDCYTSRTVGSATMALSNHADTVLKEFVKNNKEARTTAEGIFRALTQIDDTGRAIRRRLTRKELLDEVGGSKELLDQVIEAFARKDRSFLVIEEADPEQNPKIDISHEALIRHWTALNDESLDANGQPRGWAAREASDGRIWQSLVATVESAEDSAGVYLPKAVYESRQVWWDWCNPTPTWAEKHGSQFHEVESLLERSRERIEEEAQREREANRAKERARKWAKLTAVVAGIAAISLGVLASFINDQNKELERKQYELNIQNKELDRSLEQIQAQNKELERKQDKLTASLEQTAEASRQAGTAREKAESATAVAIRALEAQWRFTVDAAKNSGNMDLSDSMIDILIALEFLPNQSSANEDRRNWPLIPDIEKALKNAFDQYDRIEVVKDHSGEVDGVAYSPDGELIAIGSDDDTLRIWDAKTGQLRQELKGHSGNVDRVAFSPDGIRIVSGSLDSTARIWDIENGKELHRLEGHSGRVWGVAWSPDGVHVATGSEDNTVRIWNAETGAELLQLSGHSDAVWDVAFSPDGLRLLSASSDNTARIWNVKTGAELTRFEEHESPVYAASWSSDGELIATGGRGETVRVWEADSGRQRFTLDHEASEWVWGVAFSPDGRWLATGAADDFARIWDVKTGELKQTLTEDGDNVDAVAWSPDGTRVITGSDDGTARIMVAVYDETERKTVTATTQDLVERAKQIVPHCLSEEERASLLLAKEVPQWCRDMRKPPFDARGRLERGISMLTREPPDFDEADELFQEAKRLGPSLADEVEERRIGVLEKRGLELLKVGVDSFLKVDSVLEISDEYFKRAKSDTSLTSVFGEARLGFIIDSGRRMLLADRKSDAQQAFDKALSLAPTARHEVIVARIEAYQKLRKTDIALLLALELDQNRDDTKKLLSEMLGSETQTQTPQTLLGHKDQVDGVAYSPDGELIATGSDDDILRIWDAKTGQLRRELTGHSGDVTRIAFSPDGTRIVSGSYDETARIWDVETGEELRLMRHPDRIWGVAWSPDGVHVATGSGDNTIRIWSAETGAALLQLSGHSGAVWDVAFSPDGLRLLSASSDNTARIWNVKTGAELTRFEEHESRVYAASWSSDGELIATGGGDETVRIWEADSGRQRFTLDHEARWVWGVAFSPDGRWLATGAADDLARIWDVKTGELKQTLTEHGDNVDAVAWSPDGTRVITGSDDGTARIYDASTSDDVGQSLFNRALRKVTRPLTEEEREEFNLSSEIPEWYRRIRVPTKQQDPKN